MRATAPERPDETQELLAARACYGKTLPMHVAKGGVRHAAGPAFYFLGLTLRVIPVGIAYALWSGAGIVLISLVAWVVHGQRLDAPAMLGMGLIVAGAEMIDVFSKVAPH